MPWEFSRDHRDFTLDVSGPLLLNDSTLALQAARDRLGLLQIFEAIARADIDAGRVHGLLDDWQPPYLASISITHRANNWRPSCVFLDFMRAANTAGWAHTHLQTVRACLLRHGTASWTPDDPASPRFRHAPPRPSPRPTLGPRKSQLWATRVHRPHRRHRLWLV